jgi:hypothetical protein
MKKTLFLVICLGFVFMTYAQTEYPKGCYMNFDELKSKSPSQDFELEIVERTNGDIQMNGGNDYKLISPDKSIKKKILLTEIWAISDGENLYINCLHQKCQKWYALVESEDEYLIFRAGVSNSEAVSASVMGGALGGAMAATIRHTYSLDLETGEVSRSKVEEE